MLYVSLFVGVALYALLDVFLGASSRGNPEGA